MVSGMGVLETAWSRGKMDVGKNSGVNTRMQDGRTESRSFLKQVDWAAIWLVYSEAEAFGVSSRCQCERQRALTQTALIGKDSEYKTLEVVVSRSVII